MIQHRVDLLTLIKTRNDSVASNRTAFTCLPIGNIPIVYIPIVYILRTPIFDHLKSPPPFSHSLHRTVDNERRVIVFEAPPLLGLRNI